MTARPKAKKFQATCEDCGTRTDTNKANMKYCHSCRLFRNILWLQKKQRPKPCLVCGCDFLPVERSALVCGMCDIVEHYHGGTDCLLCHEHKPAVRNGVPVCWGCVTAPEHRPALLSALQRGRVSRIAANGWTPGTETPLLERTQPTEEVPAV
jgi:hypothetical protein